MARVVRINTDGTTSNLATGKSTNAAVRYRFAVYNDLLHITNGFDAPMTWDGTTFANMAGSPPATGRVIVMHANRAFMTATAVPSRLYYSAINNTLDWTAANNAGFIDIEPNDDSTIIDLVPSIQELVILKGRRPYRLQGIGPATGYTLQDHVVPATGSVGAISTQGAVFAMNDVFYISELGLHSLTQTQQFGDLKEAFLSDRVETYFRLDFDNSLLLRAPREVGAGVRLAAERAVSLRGLHRYGRQERHHAGVRPRAQGVDGVAHHALLLAVYRASTRRPGRGRCGRAPTTASCTRSTARRARREQISGSGVAYHGLRRAGRAEVAALRVLLLLDAKTWAPCRSPRRFDFGAAGGQVYTADLSADSSLWDDAAWDVNLWDEGTARTGIIRLDLSGLGEVVETTVQNLEAESALHATRVRIFLQRPPPHPAAEESS